jgi:hypothetical protein
MNLKKLIHEEYMDLNNVIVWHGSTKKFYMFDMSMVGTGDQNSLGGWGIYFSDNRAVSQRYYLPSGQLKQYRIRSGEYFNLDSNIDQSDNARMFTMLKRLNVSEKDLQEFDETYVSGDNYSATNKNVYDWLSYVLKSEKNASLFLSKLNYIGNTMEDRWERNARNYILFDTDVIMGEVQSDEETGEDENFDESISDRAREKMFNIKNPNTGEERRAVNAIEPKQNSTMGIFAGTIVDNEYGDGEPLSNVYANPKSLKDFDEDARAVSDINGNLFVSQFNNDFTHHLLEFAINEGGKYNIGNIYDEDNNITWQRIYHHNAFWLADTMNDYLNENPKNIYERIKVLQAKHKQFKFIPKIWWHVNDNDMKQYGVV